MSVGFRILPLRERVSADMVRSFADIPVSIVSDSMSRMTAAGARLRPMDPGSRLAGPAFTVKTRPGDNLMVHKALDLAAPGDVVVVDAGGDLTNSLVGEIMVAYAASRGLAGMVIDGAVRDCQALSTEPFPVFAAGVTHRGPYKSGPGEINVPVAIAGMVIAPGDLILGDGDGVLCVPKESAEQILLRALACIEAEKEMMSAIRAGSLDRSWVDVALHTQGCGGF